MSKNKKFFAVLSTTVIAGFIVAAVNSTVSAKATAIAITSSDGKVYEYQYDALKSSATSELLKGSNDPSAKLYNDFLQRKTSVKAFYDNVKKAYVGFDTISKEAADASAKGVSFNLGSFMESSTTPTTVITTIPVSTDSDGNVTVNGQTVIAAIDMSTVKCSNPIDPLSTLVYFKLNVLDPQNYTVTVKGKTAALDLSNNIFSVYVDGKFSVNDMKSSDFVVSKNYVSVKPTVKNVTIIDSETIRVIFSKDVDFSYASNKSNYQLLDSEGIDITSHIKGIYSTTGESDTSNTDTYNIKLNKCNPNNLSEDWRLTDSKYTLIIKNIIDTENIPNAMDDYTSSLNDTQAPTGTGIYAKPRTISGTDKDNVIVCFSKAMDATTITIKDNYKFINGQGDVKSLPEGTTISAGGDDKSAIIEFPSDYHVKTTGKTANSSAYDVTAIVVSNVKDEAGNALDGAAYNNNSKIDEPKADTKVRDNSVKIYYDGDDLKVDVTFTRALDDVIVSDFTFGGVHPNSVAKNGSKATLLFKKDDAATTAEITAHPITYANEKINNNPTKIDVIKAQGQNARFAITSTNTTDELGAKVSINSDGTSSILSDIQALVYAYQAYPKTTPDYWTATKDSNGGKVYLTFDTPLDINSGFKSDDFIFTGQNGVDIKADSVSINGNTLIFSFNATNKDYAVFTGHIGVRPNRIVSIRTQKDMQGNYSNYIPSQDDLMRRSLIIN